MIGKTIANRYRISELIGKGSFGETYRGININTLDEVAIKAEPIKTSSPQLANEFKLYQVLAGGFGVPNVEYFGRSNSYNFMVMDLLGKSLEDLFGWCNHKFSVKTVLMLADQMISCIESIHRQNLIHRDIKPDNFMIGVNRKSNLVYVIDLGLMKYYRDSRTNVHIPYTENTSMVGTARYASINSLSGVEQSRRDDLEGLGYVWAYLLRGGVPWMDVEENDHKVKYRHILEQKMRMKNEELFRGFPHAFVEYFEMVRRLKFEETPDYSRLRELLRNAMIQEGFVYDYIYDWSYTLPTFSVFRSKEESDTQFIENNMTTSTSSSNFTARSKIRNDSPHGKKLIKTNSSVSKMPTLSTKRIPSRLNPNSKKAIVSNRRRTPIV